MIVMLLYVMQHFCSVNNLHWLDPAADSVKFSYRYHNDVNGHFTLLDHFVCSRSCVDDNVNRTCVLVHGENTSNHFAISCDITLPSLASGYQDDHCHSFKIRWDRADLAYYQHLCNERLSQVDLPIEALLCQQDRCSIHNDDLQKYYCSIVNSLVSASSLAVPQIRLGVEKHWWTPELSDLKQQCIEHTDIWRQHGCPRSGPINDNRVKVKLRYKCAIKEAIISED